MNGQSLLEYAEAQNEEECLAVIRAAADNMGTPSGDDVDSDWQGTPDAPSTSSMDFEERSPPTMGEQDVLKLMLKA